MNNVEVIAFVNAELDRRHPERVQLMEMRLVEEFRATWDTLERVWSGAVGRARQSASP